MNRGINLVGNKYGMLTLLDRKRENNRTFYYCKCDCGNKKWIRYDAIKKWINNNYDSSNAKNPSCGCNKGRIKNIKNKKFSMLTAIEVVRLSENNGAIWKCKCDCGNLTEVSVSNLANGNIVSCGCYKSKKAKKNIKKVFKTFKEKNLIEDTNISYLLSSKILKNNSSGVTGVCFNNKNQRWTAQINFKKKRYHLGSFVNKEDAIKARKDAEEKLHKEFLREKGLL